MTPHPEFKSYNKKFWSHTNVRFIYIETHRLFHIETGICTAPEGRQHMSFYGHKNRRGEDWFKIGLKVDEGLYFWLRLFTIPEQYFNNHDFIHIELVDSRTHGNMGWGPKYFTKTFDTWDEAFAFMKSNDDVKNLIQDDETPTHILEIQLRLPSPEPEKYRYWAQPIRPAAEPIGYPNTHDASCRCCGTRDDTTSGIMAIVAKEGE